MNKEALISWVYMTLDSNYADDRVNGNTFIRVIGKGFFMQNCAESIEIYHFDDKEETIPVVVHFKNAMYSPRMFQEVVWKLANLYNE
jgi:hypothetical protein